MAGPYSARSADHARPGPIEQALVNECPWQPDDPGQRIRGHEEGDDGVARDEHAQDHAESVLGPLSKVVLAE